ncbi:MAG: hypothetical protein HY649_02090 [Acidobacteria bacterium]|nr:hypothetical protein [Acidobacteriota bacterium]
MSAKKTSGAVAESSRSLIGRKVEELSLAERLRWANQWVAFRIYHPPGKINQDGTEYVDVRVRRVEAAGTSVEECIAQLREGNLNPAEFEFTILKPPY